MVDRKAKISSAKKSISSLKVLELCTLFKKSHGKYSNLEKANILLELSNAYNTISFDVSLELGCYNPYDEALKFSNKAKKLIFNLHSDIRICELNAKLFVAAGISYWYLGDLAKAITEFDKALNVVNSFKNGLLDVYVNALQCKALCYHTLGNFDQAERLYNKALQVPENKLKPSTRFDLSIRMANLVGDNHQEIKAANILDNIEPLSHEDTGLRIRWLNARVLLYVDEGLFNEADLLYDEIYDLFVEFPPERSDLGAAITNAASFKIDRGWHDTAKHLLKIAASLPLDNAPIGFKIGYLKAKLRYALLVNQEDLAEYLYKQSMAYVENSMPNNKDQYITVALIAASSSKALKYKAIDALEKILSPHNIKDPFDDLKGDRFIAMQNWLCWKAAECSFEECQRLFKVVLKANMLRGRNQYSWKLWHSLALALERAEKLDIAIVIAKVALYEIKTLFKSMHSTGPIGQGFVSERRPIIEWLEHKLISKGRFKEVNEIHDTFKQSRVQEFLGVPYAQRIVKKEKIFTQEEWGIVGQYLKAQQKSFELYNTLINVSREDHRDQFLWAFNVADDFCNKIFKITPKLLPLKISYDEVPVPLGEVHITYRHQGNKIFAVVESHNHSVIVDLPEFENLADEVYKLHESIRELSNFWQHHSLSLYQKLISPIEYLLKKDNEIIFRASGLLSRIPFAALFDGDRFLIDKYTIRYKSFSQKTKAASNFEKRTALVCGFTGKYDAHEPLIGVQEELKAIENIFFKCTMQLDDGFSLDSFCSAMKNQPDVIHFATHFNFNSVYPGSSSLVFGDGISYPLYMLFKECINWKKVGLVFMSTCESGISEEGISDNSLSVQDIFLSRGVRYYIGTSWPIFDLSSVMFSKYFYQNFFSESSPSVALQLSQLQMRDNPLYTHPIHWAGYQCW